MAPKVVKYLGNFCDKTCKQELSKIVQSGHTAPDHASLSTQEITIKKLLPTQLVTANDSTLGSDNFL